MHGDDLNLLLLRLKTLFSHVLFKETLVLVEQLVEPVQLSLQTSLFIVDVLHNLADVAVVGVETLTIFDLQQALAHVVARVISPLHKCRHKAILMPSMGALT